MIKRAIILVSITICSFGTVNAQLTTDDLGQINRERLQINQSGMKVLGGWAIANMLSGGIGMTQTNGNDHYFHQMNLAWNSVNLTIAGFGYFGSRSDPAKYNLPETIREFQNLENILLFNAGLDIGYMAAGAYLWERGIRKQSDRLIGYGQSVVLQGAFLFTFDLILFAASRNKSSKLVDELGKLSINPTGISYRTWF